MGWSEGEVYKGEWRTCMQPLRAFRRHVTTKNNIKTHLASRCVQSRLQANVIDMRVRKVITAARDFDVELARHVALDWIPMLSSFLVQAASMKLDLCTQNTYTCVFVGYECMCSLDLIERLLKINPGKKGE